MNFNKVIFMAISGNRPCIICSYVACRYIIYNYDVAHWSEFFYFKQNKNNIIIFVFYIIYIFSNVYYYFRCIFYERLYDKVKYIHFET